MKKLKSFTLKAVGGANIATCAVMLAIGYTDHIDPSGHPTLSVMGLFFPAFLVLNLCFLAFWLIFHWRGAIIPILGYIIAYIPVRTYIPFNYPSDPPEGSIRILSYNVLNFGGNDAGKEGENPIIDYLVNCGADIICLQESNITPAGGERADSILRSIYQYRDTTVNAKSNDWLTIYSKFPIISKERIPYTSQNNLSAAYILDINGNKTMVVNNHFESNKLNEEDKDNFKSIVKGKLAEDSMRIESKLLIGKLAEAAKIRAAQARAVREHIRKALDKGMEVIVCGDFNDNPISYSRRTVAEGLTDCYVSSGNGPGFSYHRSGMYVRIDNIFCSDGYTPYKAKVDSKITTSDHYPISCWLKKL